MWVAEFRVWHANSGILEASKSLNASCASVYLNLTHRKGKDFVTKVLVASGPDAPRMVEAIRHEKRLRVLHVEGNQVFYENTHHNLFHAHVFNSRVFFVKPFAIRGGFEYWTVASWDKRELIALKQRIGKLKGKASIDLLSIIEKPVNLFLPAGFSNLTRRQLDAFLKAVVYGYYSLPREHSLEQLAEKLKVPRTTLREHLRKAETKLLPALAADLQLEPALATLP